ncbi:MAG: hypothetical protein ACO1OC_01680 [Tuberibacillus sp.]
MSRIEAYVQFKNINVNRLDEASGVFIGNNQANFWRSANKNNEGFGSAFGCRISQTMNIVIDNDEVDTVIHDIQYQTNDSEIQSPKSSNQLINFQNLNVNALNSNSAINMGDNRLNHWRTHHKENQGFGNGIGVNVFSRNVNSIDDRDCIDTTIRDIKTSEDNRSPS